MYGLSPKAIIEKFAKVPPEKISRRPKSSFCENKSFSFWISTTGTGMWAKSRKIANKKAVKMIFFRSSGVRQAWIIG
jgi:hypothetical protein